MKKKFKLLTFLSLSLFLFSCGNNKKEYDYSSYYEYGNVTGEPIIMVFCWKEYFDWYSCLIQSNSSMNFYYKDIEILQNKLPCKIETMKIIIGSNLEKNPNQEYLVVYTTKPVNSDATLFWSNENENKYAFLYDELNIKRSILHSYL